jgi:hypothetical protein
VRPDPLTILVDMLPDRVLWPNTGAHRRTKEPFVKGLRARAEDDAKLALASTETKSWAWDGPIRTEIEIYWPSHMRVLDWTNIHAALKPAEDGIFDVLDANDRQVTEVKLEQFKLKKGETIDGFVIYTVVALEK